MVVEGSWDCILQEWLVDAKTCDAAAMYTRADHTMYATAPVENEEGWTKLYKEDHEEPIAQEDGSEKGIIICESATMKEAVENDLRTKGPPKNGLWIGGQKYKVVQRDAEFETRDCKVTWIFASAPKKGVHIIATDQTIVLGTYNEADGQNSGNCKNAVIVMAEYLLSNGL